MKPTKRQLATAFRAGMSYALGRAVAMDEAKWITVHPNGKDAKGRPALIESETGEVLGGMGGKFNGKHISAAPNKGRNEEHGAQAKIDRAHAQKKKAKPVDALNAFTQYGSMHQDWRVKNGSGLMAFVKRANNDPNALKEVLREFQSITGRPLNTVNPGIAWAVLQLAKEGKLKDESGNFIKPKTQQVTAEADPARATSVNPNTSSAMAEEKDQAKSTKTEVPAERSPDNPDLAKKSAAYEAKIQAKRERYQELAEKKEAEAERLHGEFRKGMEAIPFGQPILLGHHSEQRDRNYRAKVNRKLDKSVEASKTAEYYRSKAKSVGTGGIMSDDPAAVTKLQEKLDRLVSDHESMKQANAICRKKISDEQKMKMLLDLGFSEKRAKNALEPDYMGRQGFPSYMLSGNNAEIKRLRDRIDSLQKMSASAPFEHDGKGFTAYEDDGRFVFEFPQRLSSEDYTRMRKAGFLWSPKREAFVRKITPNARRHADDLLAYWKSKDE